MWLSLWIPLNSCCSHQASYLSEKCPHWAGKLIVDIEDSHMENRHGVHSMVAGTSSGNALDELTSWFNHCKKPIWNPPHQTDTWLSTYLTTSIVSSTCDRKVSPHPRPSNHSNWSVHNSRIMHRSTTIGVHSTKHRISHSRTIRFYHSSSSQRF